MSKYRGGGEAKIAVIPKVSKLPYTGDIYVNIFTKMGVKEIHNLKIETCLDGTTSKEYQDILSQCTGSFMTVGNQFLLSITLWRHTSSTAYS